MRDTDCSDERIMASDWSDERIMASDWLTTHSSNYRDARRSVSGVITRRGGGGARAATTLSKPDEVVEISKATFLF